MTHADERFSLVTDWVTRELRLSPRLIEPASSDASFRRYFRVTLAAPHALAPDAATLIAMVSA